MSFYEKPTNTAARGSNNGQRSRWREQGIDPELAGNPFDMVVGSAPPTHPIELPPAPASAQPAERELSAQVAERACNPPRVPHQALAGVQLSFERR